jgi:diguanylate cyclase (GGDEF)-like protein
MILENAADYAVKLRAAIIGVPHEMESGPALPIGVSVGFACAPEHGTNFPALYHHADAGLYEAKVDNRRVMAGQGRRLG